MSKALIAFIALLGLFSFYSQAAPDDGSTCRAAAESSAQASPRFIGASTCAEYGSIFTGNDHCQVKAGPQSTCELDQFGVWTGQNYYFTGCLAGGECGNQPGGPDPTNPDLSGQLNPLTYIMPNSSTSSDPAQWVASQTSVELAKVFRLSSLNQIQLSKNDKVINDNLLALDTKLGNVDTGLQSDLSTIKSQLTAAKTQQETDTLDIKQTITDFNDDFSQASESISTDLSSLTDQVTESFTAQTQAQEKTQEDVTTVLSSMDGLYTNFSALLTDIQVEADRDYQNFDNVQNSFNNLANRMIAYREQGYYEYNDLVNRITAISNNDPDQPCGISLGDPPCPPDDGGGGTDMTETNNLIRETIGNIQGVQSAVNSVSMYSSRISSGIDSLSWSMSDLYSNNLEQLWETQAFKTQTGEQLAAIKEAIETGGGGAGDSSEIVERLDTTNYELSELKQILDSRSQATNSNLVSIGSSLQSLNDATAAQGQQLGQISGTLDGIGESLEGLKTGFEGPAMTEDDFRPEEGVLSALGITGEESVDDLTLDPVLLSDYRGQYQEFLSGTCPEYIPVQFSLLGKSYSFNLFYKPVCDFMSIAGTILNFTVWFGVPFIVFGSRRVS